MEAIGGILQVLLLLYAGSKLGFKDGFFWWLGNGILCIVLGVLAFVVSMFLLPGVAKLGAPLIMVVVMFIVSIARIIGLIKR